MRAPLYFGEAEHPGLHRCVTLKSLDPRLRGDDGWESRSETDLENATVRLSAANATPPDRRYRCYRRYRRAGTNFTSDGDTIGKVCTVSPSSPLAGSRAITTRLPLC